MKDLTYKGFDQVGPAEWKILIERVQRVFEDRYWLDDGLQEESIDEFVMVRTMSHPVRAAVSQMMRVIATLHTLSHYK